MPPRPDQRRFARALLPLLAWLCGICSQSALWLLRRPQARAGSQHLANDQDQLPLRQAIESQRRSQAGSLALWIPRKAAAQLRKQLDPRQLYVCGCLRSQGNIFYPFSSSCCFNQLIIGLQGVSLWLNTGSRVWLEWRVSSGGDSYTDMLVVLIKGEQNLEGLERFCTTSHNYLGNSRNGSRAEYFISEDSMYYLGVINLTPRSVVMNMSITVASKVYDASKATSVCSTGNGVCKLKLPFPNTQYYVLTTSGGDVSNIELSFIARLTAYFIITVIIVIIISILLKHLGALRQEQPRQEHQVAETQTETDPIVPRKVMACTYGTTEEEPESSVCCSSEDLYDGTICVICYDVKRNCFFTPCGHCVTCYSCAQRIMEEDKKVCPICRRFIHKARRLPST